MTTMYRALVVAAVAVVAGVGMFALGGPSDGRGPQVEGAEAVAETPVSGQTVAVSLARAQLRPVVASDAALRAAVEELRAQGVDASKAAQVDVPGTAKPGWVLASATRVCLVVPRSEVSGGAVDSSTYCSDADRATQYGVGGSYFAPDGTANPDENPNAIQHYAFLLPQQADLPYATARGGNQAAAKAQVGAGGAVATLDVPAEEDAVIPFYSGGSQRLGPPRG